MDPDFDSFMKTMKKKRYLKFQGLYLYYPIATLDDPVSLLSCFLNSEEFKESLRPEWKNWKKIGLGEMNGSIEYIEQI